MRTACFGMCNTLHLTIDASSPNSVITEALWRRDPSNLPLRRDGSARSHVNTYPFVVCFVDAAIFKLCDPINKLTNRNVKVSLPPPVFSSFVCSFTRWLCHPCFEFIFYGQEKKKQKGLKPRRRIKVNIRIYISILWNALKRVKIYL